MDLVMKLDTFQKDNIQTHSLSIIGQNFGTLLNVLRIFKSIWAVAGFAFFGLI